MTSQPSVNPFVQYILVNPYPVSIALLAIGLVMAWMALNAGQLRSWRRWTALALIVVGAAVLITGLIVVTPGEHGRTVTREFVQRATSGDVAGAAALLDEELTLSLGSPMNPGVRMDRAAIAQRLDTLHARYPIKSNMVRMLDGHTIGREEADVYLGCLTSTEYGFTPSRWIIRVRRNGKGEWVIVRITCVDINNQTPASNRLW